MGVVQRRQIADDVKALGQEDRGLLRKHGVRFGQHNIFMPLLLKPAPTRLRLILWSLWEGFEEFPEAPPPGLVTIPAVESAPQGYYEKVGYRLCGQRALRIDMLERLADLIRPMDVRAGFEATPDMLSITGCTLEQFADIARSLGFDAERGERPKVARVAEPAVEAEPEAGAGESAEAEAAAAPAAEAAATPAAEAAAAPEAEAAAAPEAAVAAPEAEAAEAAPEETGDARAEADTGGEAQPEAEIEVFYTFRLRPRARQGQGRRPEGGRKEAPEGARKGAPRRQADGQGEGGRPKGKKPFKGKRRDQDAEAPKPRPERPRREDKPLDPDSPFAVLMKLKNR
jgi:ATP-dependent RNA helicase SUPV3L1/SUV3